MGKLAAQGEPGVRFMKVDVSKYGALAHEKGVRSIPDTRIYHNGQELEAFVGTRDARGIKALIAGHRSKLVAREAPQQTIAPEGQRNLPPGIQSIPAS